MPAFTNMATLTYNGNTVNSNVVTGQIRQSLTAMKTALRDTYGPGEDVTYVVSLVNTGSTALTELTLTDDLGGYQWNGETVYPLSYEENTLQLYVNGVLQPTPTVTAEPELVVTGINVPAGGNVLVVYETEVTGFAPLTVDGEIVNTVTVSGGGLSENITAQETVTVRQEASLVITKALEPAEVPENGQITYTFTIQNFGNVPVVATDDAVLTDDFDPILSGLTVTYNGTAWAQGDQYTYDPATGIFATVPGQILVPAAEITQNPDGTWSTTPGTAVLTVTGTV